jgi:hypothetical protein
MMKDNNYIELLKWGRAKGEVTDQELIQKLNEYNMPSGYGGNPLSLNFFVQGIFFRTGDKNMLTFDAVFELNEHERLEEARKSSRNAMWIAIGAMIISALVGLWQIMLMYYSSDAI